MTQPDGTVEAIELPPHAAAPLLGGPNPLKVHALNSYGQPSCMNPTRPPIYDVNYDLVMRQGQVPSECRCSRWGCAEAWLT